MAAWAATEAATTAILVPVLEEAMERALRLGPEAAEEYVEARLRLETSRESTILSAANAFSRAASAFSGVASATPDALSTVNFELANVALKTTFGEPLTDADGVAMRARVTALGRASEETKLQAYADAIRARVSFAELGPPGDDEETLTAELAQQGARELLRERLTPLVPMLRLWGNPRALEALEVVSAMLEAPGPLNRASLAPALQTMHERVANLFAAHAAETDDEQARAQAREAADQAREAAHEMNEMIAERPARPSN